MIKKKRGKKSGSLSISNRDWRYCFGVSEFISAVCLEKGLFLRAMSGLLTYLRGTKFSKTRSEVWTWPD